MKNIKIHCCIIIKKLKKLKPLTVRNRQVERRKNLSNKILMKLNEIK